MKKYEELELELIRFDAEDVITESGEVTTPEIPIPENNGSN